MSRQGEFARLLRWYPASWRRSHGEVVLGTMLDVAEAQGRDAPTRGERRAAIVDGLAHRLDRRIAIGAAVAAVGTAALVWAAQLTVSAVAAGIDPRVDSTLTGWMQAIVALSGAVPALAVVSLVATARVRGMRSGPVLLGGAVGVAAAIALALTMLSWSVGFEEADAGGMRSPLGAAFLVILGIAWTLAAVATAILLGEALRRRLGGGSYPVALGVGLVGWPFLAYSLLSVASAVLLALGLLAVAVIATGPLGAVEREGPHHTGSWTVARPALQRGRRLIIVLSSLSVAAGAAAGVFALAGSVWTGLDATQAMRVGIGAGALGAIPLALCLGVRRGPGLHSWAPPILVALGLVFLALANVFGSGDGSNLPLLLAAVPVAAAVAWGVATLPRLATGRVVLSVATAAATLVLSPMLQMLPFVSPVIAVIVLLATTLKARRQGAKDIAAAT